MSTGSDAGLKALFEQVGSISPGERADFVEMVLCAGIGIMRAAAGDQFVRGFLEAALADLDKPAEIFIAQRTH